jgi:uncharacterized protein YjiS (DUF1127 family)
MNIRPTDLPAAVTPQERRPLFGLVVECAAHVFRVLSRRRQRRDLRELDDRQLYDVGITRAQVERESRKPFWKS